MSKCTSVTQSPSNPTPTLMPQSILTCPRVTRPEFENSTPVPLTTNSLNIQKASNTSPSIPSTSLLKSSSIPETPKIKRTRDSKKQTKKIKSVDTSKRIKRRETWAYTCREKRPIFSWRWIPIQGRFFKRFL
ncbi:hypothetical protein AVEN_259553-1 [Araneus ventricosus]|uniref:Uncharacterized protein n=1 Tax=Araneus ventricosus TaxID=182803 RepID=A0A4Y2EN94_ARAVE|nr:hypothetical protein AVEN_259553-1 [Araneus ventricosus]